MSGLTDRELLEGAARAAGIAGSVYSFPGMLERYGFNEAIYDDASDSHWNPLTDDGDALRLAVRCGILFGVGKGENTPDVVWHGSNGVEGLNIEPCAEVAAMKDMTAGVRRVIVRAAYEIGSAKP